MSSKNTTNFYGMTLMGRRRAGRSILPEDIMINSSKNTASLTSQGTKRTSLGCDGGLKKK